MHQAFQNSSVIPQSLETGDRTRNLDMIGIGRYMDWTNRMNKRTYHLKSFLICKHQLVFFDYLILKCLNFICLMYNPIKYKVKFLYVFSIYFYYM